jgi:RHS repeat-associated protein
VVRAEVLYYVNPDHLGTPRSIVKASNNAEVWRWDSDPFGTTAATGSFAYNLRFPGQYYDSEAGRHYNWMRDYDPQTGRYLQADPIGLSGGMNRYGYVGGRPLTSVDPMGLASLCYDRGAGTLSLYGSDGNRIGTWDAHNTTKTGWATWPDGQFDFVWYSKNGDPIEVGDFGNFIFKTGRNGQGVHGGVFSQKTRGCIRTADHAMKTIISTVKDDPMQSITVSNYCGGTQ